MRRGWFLLGWWWLVGGGGSWLVGVWSGGGLGGGGGGVGSWQPSPVTMAAVREEAKGGMQVGRRG